MISSFFRRTTVPSVTQLQLTIRHKRVFLTFCTLLLYALFAALKDENILSSLNLKSSDVQAKVTKEIILYQPFKVAVIGGAGYIGSMLTLYLKSVGYEVTAFDDGPLLLDSFPVLSLHSGDIKKSTLQTFGTVIFLGGCTGRRTCSLLSPKQRFQKNVQDVVDLVEKLTPEQQFIAASTSAISEGGQHATEADAVFEHLLDDYAKSMYQREQELRRISSNPKKPRITMLRFGTVVGNSIAQRTDLLVPSLFKSAYTQGILKVQGAHTMRSFLWLHDLVRAIGVVIQDSNKATIEVQYERFNIWNLASFSATIMKVAATVSSITGARMDVEGDQDDAFGNSTVTPNFHGFSLNSSLFEMTFNFTFEGNLTVALLDVDSNVPSSITAKGIHRYVTGHEKQHELRTIPCPVCGSKDQQLALDLGDQPFANDFQREKEKALSSPRYPLKLIRCRQCNHFHLSHIASRDDLFVNYLYQSGTTKTLSSYFQWLAKKVIEEANHIENGTVLEIACNDGSQLDQFKNLGWKTFGVDPAANIAPLAQAKGHSVKVGFWGTTDLLFPELPTGDKLNAIVAQNVLAHVPNPVAFLKSCAAIMGPTTLLYIQTSQCNMHQLGQFDTAYHEHISFFTGHSFLEAATLAGLYILSFETTPIHGTSCLVTMQIGKSEQSISESLQERLESEVMEGITTDFFYEKYAQRAFMIRSWLTEQTKFYGEQGYTIGAYGAAAKGMTLLHFLFNGGNLSQAVFDFVLDDATLKQKTYCPGTSIPVLATESISDKSPLKPTVLIILAWNFWEEVATNLKSQLHGQDGELIIILPFPTPRVVSLNLDDEEKSSVQNSTTIVREMPYNPTSIPNPLRSASRDPVLLVTHMNNEEMLLPFFIIQHAPMFDKVILIDFDSTDSSVSIVEKYAPPSWQVVKSTTGAVFDAEETDMQVMYWEKQYADHWAIALTVTEFLIFPNFRGWLMRMHPVRNDEKYIYLFHAIKMMGDDATPLKHFTSLPEQRHHYEAEDEYHRFFHKGTSESYRYSPGRHGYGGEGVEVHELFSGFIMKWLWTPWPESAERKMNIGEHIPQTDKDKGFGVQHFGWFSTREELETLRSSLLAERQLHDLCHQINENKDLLWIHQVYYNAFGKLCYSL